MLYFLVFILWGPGEFMQYLPIFFRITSLGSACPIASELTHISLDKMAAISQTIFSDEFPWMKRYVI